MAARSFTARFGRERTRCSIRAQAFLRVTKAGFAFSARFGTGLVVARLPRGGWSAPSAIGTVGASFGFQLGAQVADFLVVLNTDAALRWHGGVRLRGESAPRRRRGTAAARAD